MKKTQLNDAQLRNGAHSCSKNPSTTFHVNEVEKEMNLIDYERKEDMIKLFSGSSVKCLEDTPGILYPRVDVTTHYDWFCAHRDQPVAPYPELIDNYELLSEEDKVYAEASVNSLFTEEEVAKATAFLKDELDMEMKVYEASLPIQWRKDDPLCIDEAIVTQDAESCYKLSDAKGYELYELDIPIWGIYDQTIGCSEAPLKGVKRDDTLNLANALFELAGVPAPENLPAILDKIYQCSGLYGVYSGVRMNENECQADIIDESIERSLSPSGKVAAADYVKNVVEALGCIMDAERMHIMDVVNEIYKTQGLYIACDESFQIEKLMRTAKERYKTIYPDPT